MKRAIRIKSRNITCKLFLEGFIMAEIDFEKALKAINLTDEKYLSIDDTEFRARFRERVHHTLEIQTYATVYRGGKLNPNQPDTAKHLVSLWEQRGLSKELSDYIYAKKLISLAEDTITGKPVTLEKYAPKKLSEADTELFYTILKERRSVREYTDERVPDELIDKILEAGLWAAHSCNLQSIRYLVVREELAPGLFKGSDVPGGPVHLVVLQDERVYQANTFMPIRNRLLDAGAAAQNIALAAHAVGLEGVWLTFNDKIIARLRDYFKVPDYVSIVTYVDVGYGDQTPFPPLRGTVKDAVIGRT